MFFNDFFLDLFQFFFQFAKFVKKRTHILVPCVTFFLASLADFFSPGGNRDRDGGTSIAKPKTQDDLSFLAGY